MQIPVGLLPSTKKKASVCALQVQDIIRCYEISDDDVFLSVNDTTNSAVATGKAIADGKAGTCGMHSIDLAMEHATNQTK